MAKSSIQRTPLKYIVLMGVGFTFSNSSLSAGKSISSLTNGLVTDANVIAIDAMGKGGQFMSGMDSNAGNIFLKYASNLNGTYYANLIIYYK